MGFSTFAINYLAVFDYAEMHGGNDFLFVKLQAGTFLSKLFCRGKLDCVLSLPYDFLSSYFYS